MRVHADHDLEAMIDRASLDAAVLWPLDRAIAANPLVDRVDLGFAAAVERVGARLGVDLWPSRRHLEELVERGLILSLPEDGGAERMERPPTIAERSATARVRVDLGSLVGQVLLDAAMEQADGPRGLLGSATRILRSRSSWAEAPLAIRREMAALLDDGGLDGIVARLVGWTATEVTEEFARHLARIPGWAAWAKWTDCWAAGRHPAAVTRAEVVAISLAADLAVLDAEDRARAEPPQPLSPSSSDGGMVRLELLERAVHGEVLDELAPRRPLDAGSPRLQVVTCIDVRSEPLRRAIEIDAEAETLGFAGFFGVFAEVLPAGELEPHASLPVIASPSAWVTGGLSPTALDQEQEAMAASLAQLTHEPEAMFALAEVTGVLGSPVLLARSLWGGRAPSASGAAGTWEVEVAARADVGEGALRGMGLTSGFALEVLFLGHGATTTNNPHQAALECGACAGHAGGPNAAALAAILNDPSVRGELRGRGIDIPTGTTFLWGVHDTTREVVELGSAASDWTASLLARAGDEVATWRTGGDRSPAAAHRQLDRRAGDWAEVRPEWGLADHVAFVVAPRASIRGRDLRGRCFLHSYDPGADEDGGILRSILAAPMVVAQWINAAYYFSTVAPEVLGAGDKTRHNPVGDFAVIEGDHPDLRLGLPWQSLASGDRLVHLPARLLVAIEAPLERIAEGVATVPAASALVEGGWVRLVGRTGPLDPWRQWMPGEGWGAS